MMRKFRLPLFRLLCPLLMVWIGTASAQTVGTIRPTDLTCEYLKNPEVIDVAQPRLSWINTADENIRGASQSAWQIQVASSQEGTAGWESRPLGQQKDQRRSIDPRSIRREAAPIAANLLVARPGMGQQRGSIRMERTGLLGHGHPQPLRMEGTMDRSSVAGRSIVGRYGRTDSASRTAVA